MLAITKVVLYKHGVGYFEREGEIEGDTSIQLEFRREEMNDVLKSLTVLDLGDGLVSSISYESTEPLEKRLEDIAIRLPEQNALTGLLSQIKGARVEVEVAGQTVVGTVMGIETVERPAREVTYSTSLLSLLVDGSTLATFDLLELQRLELLDESLRTDLARLLEVLISAKKKDAKKLSIFTRGEGRRKLIAAYVVESPVWKTSYRVVLGSGKDPLIQGWALVDNTQDEDWIDVRLTLVAGLPVSFVHDLHTPRYRRRPVVEVSEEEAYGPPMLEDAMEEEYLNDMKLEASGYDAGALPSAVPAPEPRMARMRSKALEKSMPVETVTRETGDLFQYEVENPVTVRRGESALVPILQTRFGGEKVAIYNKAVREKNPMTAVLFKNTTGLTLEGGPVTFFEDETYVGESMLDTIKPEEEKLVPYSVELGCVVGTDHRSTTGSVHRVQIASGVLHAWRHFFERTGYVIRNKTDRDIDLLLDHAVNRGWELVETPEPKETTENFYRFRFPVKAGETVRFPVVQRRNDSDTYRLADLDPDSLAVWFEGNGIDGIIRAQLEELIELTADISGIEKSIGERVEEVEEIREDQERLRENLKALAESTSERSLRDRYVGELERGEDRLRELQDELKDARVGKATAERKLARRVGELSYERDV